MPGRCVGRICLRISEGGICSLGCGLLFVILAFVVLPFDVKLSICVHVSIVVGQLDSLGQVLFDDVAYCGFADSYSFCYASV